MSAAHVSDAPWPNARCLGSCHLFDRIGDAFLLIEMPGARVIRWNSAATRMFGYPRADSGQLLFTDIFPERLNGSMAVSRDHGEDGRKSVLDSARPVELHGLRRGGTPVEVEASFGAVDGDSLGREFVLAIVRDISAHKRADAELADRALHDHLTGLPNRWLLEDRFRQTALAARRTSGAFAVLLLDINRFKQMNDELGHLGGDAALRHVADHLVASIRESDTVARIGGDEFLFLLPTSQQELEAAKVAERVLREVATPIVIGGRSLTVHATIGAAMFPRDGGDLETLLDRADQAMYRAKHARRSFAVFSQPGVAI